MVIIYTPHLKKRLKERKFPYGFPKKIYNGAEIRLYDDLRKTCIAIKKLPYGGKSRKISIAYIQEGNCAKIITIHPENDKEINKRIKNRRWIKL